jgi:hypothetical protein
MPVRAACDGGVRHCDWSAALGSFPCQRHVTTHGKGARASGVTLVLLLQLRELRILNARYRVDVRGALSLGALCALKRDSNSPAHSAGGRNDARRSPKC